MILDVIMWDIAPKNLRTTGLDLCYIKSNDYNNYYIDVRTGGVCISPPPPNIKSVGLKCVSASHHLGNSAT